MSSLSMLSDRARLRLADRLGQPLIWPRAAEVVDLLGWCELRVKIDLRPKAQAVVSPARHCTDPSARPR
mgnify:CR=1 FL=1